MYLRRKNVRSVTFSLAYRKKILINLQSNCNSPVGDSPIMRQVLMLYFWYTIISQSSSVASTLRLRVATGACERVRANW